MYVIRMSAQSPHQLPILNIKHINIVITTTSIQQIFFHQHAINVSLIEAIFRFRQIDLPRRFRVLAKFHSFPLITVNMSMATNYEKLIGSQQAVDRSILVDRYHVAGQLILLRYICFGFQEFAQAEIRFKVMLAVCEADGSLT